MYQLPRPEDIKRLRKDVSLTQIELAKRARVSQSLIARIESGTVDPRMSTLRRILEVMNDCYLSKSPRVTVSQVMCSPVFFVKATDFVHTAIELMEKHGVSQLPVMKDESLVGTISEATVIRHISSGKNVFNSTVNDIMDESLPSVPPSTGMDEASELMSRGHPAVLVVDRGRIVGIVTKIDLISHRSRYKK
ncbi:MAG: CBS domain-containing protein [Candidatus Atabeyarchaeum deiterrae]